MSNRIKINEDIFDELIVAIRYCDGDEDLEVEICSSEGDMLIYDNGRIVILHGGYHWNIHLEQLVEYQKTMLTNVLMDYVERVVEHIISEAIPKDVG